MRARFGTGAAAGSVGILLQKSAAFELVLADPQVQGFYAAPGPVGVVFFACQLRNHLHGLMAAFSTNARSLGRLGAHTASKTRFEYPTLEYSAPGYVPATPSPRPHSPPHAYHDYIRTTLT